MIFNGDTWQELARPFRVRAEVMLEELQAICEEEGADAVFLSGNHDPGWSGPGWVSLADGRIIITHGDALLFDGSPWKREILVAGKRVMELWDEHPDGRAGCGGASSRGPEDRAGTLHHRASDRPSCPSTGLGRGGAADARGENA